VAGLEHVVVVVQEVWLGVSADLNSVVSSIQEIFSLGIPEVAAVQAIHFLACPQKF
jgi:hypothetical protein